MSDTVEWDRPYEVVISLGDDSVLINGIPSTRVEVDGLLGDGFFDAMKEAVSKGIEVPVWSFDEIVGD